MSEEISHRIIKLYHALKNDYNFKFMVYDIVPAYNEIAVHFNPVAVNRIDIIHAVEERMRNVSDYSYSAKVIEFGVNYDGEDLDELCDIHKMTKDEIIDLHTENTYFVAMIGFRPNFPYLMGMDKRLETPRRKSPRTCIPAGSVAIGGLQTGIYSVDGPGGWNIIGSTDIEMLKNVSVGDKIKFRRM